MNIFFNFLKCIFIYILYLYELFFLVFQYRINILHFILNYILYRIKKKKKRLKNKKHLKLSLHL
jgi:hypothetical protein